MNLNLRTPPPRPHRPLKIRRMRCKPRQYVSTPTWRQIRAIDTNRIFEIVYRESGIGRRELIGPGRSKQVAAARRLTSYLLLASGWDLSGVGSVLGGRDHSTIIYHREKVRGEMLDDPKHKLWIGGLIHELHKATEAKQ